METNQVDPFKEFTLKFNRPDHVINITPMSTPRPRATLMMVKNAVNTFSLLKQKDLIAAKKLLKAHIYMPTKYNTYKDKLTWMIKGLRLPKSDYSVLMVRIYLPYPKSTPKIRRINKTFHRKKPDADNFCKGLMDALENAQVIKNDGQIAWVNVMKLYTTNSVGRIEFSIF